MAVALAAGRGPSVRRAAVTTEITSPRITAPARRSSRLGSRRADTKAGCVVSDIALSADGWARL